ncbi:MAG TPA: glycosyltransferase family 4 protein, partial [Steroidobacteraceae bacterium]|nr:glycosyltransferase family 4 protein [Steroidobacteraceae bacterium]
IHSLSSKYRFSLLTAGGRSDEHADVTALGAARGLRTQPLSLLLRSWARLWSTRPEFDVLNPQTPLSALAARMVKRKFGIPYVVTVHIFGAEPAHAGGRLQASAYSRVESLVFSNADAIIPTGRRLGEALKRKYPGIAAKVSVVTAAGQGVREVAPRDETRLRFGIEKHEQLLLFLGRLVEENGLEETLEAFVHLKQNRAGLRMLIAGTGNQQAQVAEKIRELNVSNEVRMIGAMRGQTKLDLLAAADLMVRSSRHEVFPEAYLESFSVGTPVAATPAGDTSLMAEDSQAIELLPIGDPAGQAAVISRLLDDPARLARMRESALDYSRRFVWDAQKDRYASLLEAAGGGRA